MASPYRVLAYTILPLMRARIWHIEGMENIPPGGCILVANHQSWIDSPILAGAVYKNISKSLRFIAQSSKYHSVGGIPINEYNKASVIDIADGYLESGHPVVIFPEGNSNKNPELRSGKTGAARLALRSGLPVVPIGMHGTRGVKVWWALLWFFSLWRPCRVTIGVPIHFEKITLNGRDGERLQEVTNAIMNAISAVSGKPFNPDTARYQIEPSKVFIERIVWGWLYPLLKWRIHVAGADNLPMKGPYIIVGNHTSYFDPGAVVMAALKSGRPRPFFMTKDAISKTWRKLLGRNAWQGLGMLPIDNTDKSKVVQSAIDHLKRGGVVGLFPEGTRNKPKLNPDWQTTMLKGRTGIARLVAASGAPVIPAAIRSPRGQGIIETLGNVFKFWKPIWVTFGAPVNFDQLPTSDPTKEDLERLTKQVMLRLSEMTGMKYPY